MTCVGTQFVVASPDVAKGSLEHLLDNDKSSVAVLMVPAEAIR